MHNFLDITHKLAVAWAELSEYGALPEYDPEYDPESDPREGVRKSGRDAHWRVDKLINDARAQLSLLELIASPSCVRAAQKLVEALDEEDLMYICLHNESANTIIGERMDATQKLRQRFVSACRASLGTGRGFRGVTAQIWWKPMQ